LLSAKDIFVSYSGSTKTNELDGVSLSIVPGQIAAVVGPNGSGKSTLIRSLSRVLEPSRGAILLNGDNLYRVVKAQESARAISVAPQDTHVAFDFTAREIVAMGLAPHRSGWALFAGESNADRDVVDNALIRAHITSEQAGRPVMTLSGGERQRVLIARAIVQDADVLLLDEPTASLDLSHQASLFDELRRLARKHNKAVVAVLHDLNQAASIADRMIVLSSGRVVADGPIESVMTRELIEDVYHCSVHIGADLVTGRLTISPSSNDASTKSLRGKSVYVFCGGGGGAEIIRRLSQAGASVNAGLLREGDMDLAVADALGVQFERKSTFAPLPDLGDDEIRAIAAACDFIIFAPSTVTKENLSSLIAARALAVAGIPMYTMQKFAAAISAERGNGWKRIIDLWLDFCSVISAPPFSSPTELVDWLSGEANA
jgi:iron complex transport system ATP-binding protein